MPLESVKMKNEKIGLHDVLEAKFHDAWTYQKSKSLRMIASFTDRTIRTVKDTVILQEDLNYLEVWGVERKMVFYPSKCQHLRVTNKIKITQAQYSILGTTLVPFKLPPRYKV